MGTAISVDVRDAPIPRAVDRVFEWFRWVDETFSTYKSESQINRLGLGETLPRRVRRSGSVGPGSL